MSKKLAGVIFVYNGQMYDYCYLEAIKCLYECTDHVFVVAGGGDGTVANIFDNIFHNDRYTFIEINEDWWHLKEGKEKLSYFTNIGIEAAEKMGYDYILQIQADEILHESAYIIIRALIESGCEGFMCKRINLWQDAYHQLNVPIERMPCSTEIVRLAKTKYRSWDDAENIRCDDVNESYTNMIEIWHYGFIRDKKIMKDKVINMQENVFGIDHDPKLDNADEFKPDRWFSKSDLQLIRKQHPKIMSEWIKTRP